MLDVEWRGVVWNGGGGGGEGMWRGEECGLELEWVALIKARWNDRGGGWWWWIGGGLYGNEVRSSRGEGER